MVFATTICEHLVGTFTQLMEGTDGGKDWEDKVITGKGLLNTMETIGEILKTGIGRPIGNSLRKSLFVKLKKLPVGFSRKRQFPAFS